MSFLLLWVVVYVVSIFILMSSSLQYSSHLYEPIASNLIWILIFVTQFLFVRKLAKADFEGFQLPTLYLMYAAWVLFSVIKLNSLSLVLSIPIVFLSWQIYRKSVPIEGFVLKHLQSIFTGSLLFSWSVVVLYASLSFYFTSVAAITLMLLSSVFIASLLAHFKADLVTSLVFSWSAFAIGIDNLSGSYYIAIAGISFGSVLLITAYFAYSIAKEDPSKNSFASVNPSPEEELDLRITREKTKAED